jgi:L-fuconolactonase
MSDNPVTYQELLGWMDAAGVAAALLVTIAPYGPDNSYTQEAAAAYPDRFAVVGRVEASAPDLEERIAGWRGTGMVGVRLIVGSEVERESFRSGGHDRLLAACASAELPLCIYPPGILAQLLPVAQRHPALPLVIDHLGLAQPPLMRADAEPFERLPELLALARLPNVAVKLTGMPALSRERYPFADLREPLLRILDAFSPERVLWGSDATRTSALHSYSEAVAFIRESPYLGAGAKTAVLGGALRRIFRWPRA